MQIENITYAYGKERLIIDNIDCAFERGKITSIIGPNGSGKSTLLSLCNRLNCPKTGSLCLDGKNIACYKSREFAKIVASVFQQNEAKNDISVRDLVAYGRTPHKKQFAFLTEEDEKIIDESMRLTGLTEFEERNVMSLSGGERQRVYVALAHCQQPQILFLDEPTTFLDIRYQLEIMEIVRLINKEKGITVVMVLHDINQAVSYSDNIIIMKDGRVQAAGDAKETMTADLISKVFGVSVKMLCDGESKLFFAGARV